MNDLDKDLADFAIRQRLRERGELLSGERTRERVSDRLIGLLAMMFYGLVLGILIGWLAL